MSPQQRELRKREIEAEKVPEEQVAEMIEKVSDEEFLVQSFTLEDVVYEIKISGIEVCTCNCADFAFYRSPCKHIYLLIRGFPTFIISRSITYINNSLNFDLNHEEVQYSQGAREEIEAIDIASKFERIGELIRGKELSQTILIKLDNLCTRAFNEINENNLAPNAHFERQRN